MSRASHGVREAWVEGRLALLVEHHAGREPGRRHLVEDGLHELEGHHALGCSIAGLAQNSQEKLHALVKPRRE